MSFFMIWLGVACGALGQTGIEYLFKRDKETAVIKLKILAALLFIALLIAAVL